MRAPAALAAATALNLPFGTLYAFSVFLKPLEALLGVGRAELSVVFALATVTLTGGMVLAPSVYRRFPAWAVCVACGACAGGGLLLAASASTFANEASSSGCAGSQAQMPLGRHRIEPRCDMSAKREPPPP